MLTVDWPTSAATLAAIGPQDVWTAWSLDPLVLGALAAAAWIHRQGGPGAADPWRARAFAAGLAAVAVALLSPLEALSGALASAHMTQHVLLVAVAAPLLALSTPSHRLLRGTPLAVRRATGRWRARLGLSPPRTRLLRHPAVVWFLPVATLWIWHSRAAYDLAVRNELAHVIEHATLLGAALLLWTWLVQVDRGRDRAYGLAILVVFTVAMSSVFLSVLLTFATGPWYDAYLTTTAAFGLTPLADQQLAGVILWVPAGAVYVAAGLTLVVRWIATSDDDGTDATRPGQQMRGSGSPTSMSIRR